MAVTLDYDNGMLNKRPRPFTFLHQVTSHRHGTIGEVYDLSEPAYRDLNSRFGFYTTSKGVGFYGVQYDYDNGMQTQAPALSHSNHGTIGDDPTSQGQTLKDLKSRFGFYTTSKGVGLSATYDYDNGMLNTTSDDVPLTLTCPY